MEESLLFLSLSISISLSKFGAREFWITRRERRTQWKINEGGKKRWRRINKRYGERWCDKEGRAEI